MTQLQHSSEALDSSINAPTRLGMSEQSLVIITVAQHCHGSAVSQKMHCRSPLQPWQCASTDADMEWSCAGVTDEEQFPDTGLRKPAQQFASAGRGEQVNPHLSEDLQAAKDLLAHALQVRCSSAWQWLTATLQVSSL
jgi:hypothetical protein